MFDYIKRFNVVDVPTNDFDIIVSDIKIENPYKTEISIAITIGIAIMIILIIGLRYLIKRKSKNSQKSE